MVVNRIQNTVPANVPADTTDIGSVTSRETLNNNPEDLDFPPILEPLIMQYRDTLFSGKRGKSNQYEHRFVVKSDYKPSMSKHYELPGKKKLFAKPVIED